MIQNMIVRIGRMTGFVLLGRGYTLVLFCGVSTLFDQVYLGPAWGVLLAL